MSTGIPKNFMKQGDGVEVGYFAKRRKQFNEEIAKGIGNNVPREGAKKQTVTKKKTDDKKVDKTDKEKDEE